jgi:8-oxo-dGTP pyrophosphatase MutT (NUDIX family)
MRYGISAGGIVIRDDRLLLVHHRGVEQGAFDFWVGPGGRLEGSESIFDCAQREAFEETGLRVDPLRIVYIEEFVEPDYHFCKFWILCRELGGSLTLDNENPAEHQVVEARFLAYPEMQGLRVYPEVFKDGLWEDARQGFPATRYLGLQRTS